MVVARKPETRRRTATRARLLDGALEVLAERGFHGASVEDVCERAGFTRGAFYSNFSSKDELVLALYESTTQRLLERIEALPATLKEQPGSLLDAVLGILDELDADRRRWHLVYTEFTLHALRDPAAGKAWARQRQLFVDRLTELIEQIATAGGLRLKVTSAEFVRLVIALHEGSRTQSLLQPRDRAARDLERTFLPLILAAVSTP